jgi:hypothetical protein
LTTNTRIDVAVGKPAKQSTTSRWTTPFGPQGVLLGFEAEDFGFHTELEDSPWWEVDLLWPYPIDEIKVHNRARGLEERAESLIVESSIDGVKWDLIRSGRTLFSSVARSGPATIFLDGRTTARYIRLSLNEKQYFHLSQVEVLVSEEKVRLAECQSGPRLRKRFSAHGSLTTDVTVVGTSNSVMSSGYTSSLESETLRIAKNVSLGSSHPVFIPYRLDHLANLPSDVLVLDLAVNEQRALQRGLYDLGLSRQIFEYTLSYCAAAKAIPIVLIMPSLDDYTNYRNGVSEGPNVRQHYIDMCNEMNVPYFDSYLLLDKLARYWRREPTTFFLNNAHLNPFFAQILGAALNRAILDLDSRRAHPDLNVGNRKAVLHPFEAIPLATDKVPAEAIIRRRTSITEVDLVRLSMNQKIEFSIPPSSSVVGLVINMAQTNASIEISATHTHSKRLDNLYFDPSRSLWHCAWSVLNPVYTCSGDITLRAVEPQLTHEDNDHTAPGRLSTLDVGQDIVAEMSHLIIRTRPETRELIEVLGTELDLMSRVDLRFVVPLTSIDCPNFALPALHGS